MVPAGLLVSARLAGTEDVGAVVLLALIAPYVYALAVVASAAAASARRWALAGVAALCAVLGMAWSLPEFAAAQPIPPAANAPSAPRLRVLTQNLRVGNSHVAALADVVRRVAPDVLVLVELSEGNLDELARTAIFERYPYRIADPRGGGYGIGLFSRFPIHGEAVTAQNGLRIAEAVVDVAGRSVRVIGAHVLGARWVGGEAMRRQTGLLADHVRASSEAVVVAGDLNCGWNHAAFRDLLRTGLTDAAVDLGRGYVGTWPTFGPLPSIVRVDHLLVSASVIPLWVSTWKLRGSDHRGVAMEVALI